MPSTAVPTAGGVPGASTTKKIPLFCTNPWVPSSSGKLTSIVVRCPARKRQSWYCPACLSRSIHGPVFRARLLEVHRGTLIDPAAGNRGTARRHEASANADYIDELRQRDNVLARLGEVRLPWAAVGRSWPVVAHDDGIKAIAAGRTPSDDDLLYKVQPYFAPCTRPLALNVVKTCQNARDHTPRLLAVQLLRTWQRDRESCRRARSSALKAVRTCVSISRSGEREPFLLRSISMSEAGASGWAWLMRSFAAVF